MSGNSLNMLSDLTDECAHTQLICCRIIIKALVEHKHIPRLLSAGDYLRSHLNVFWFDGD